MRRIIERERVKAEIDAANRIQAALLPLEAPHLAGTTISSHYRAATEFGGDYFDFLQQPSGEVGIAFGDVSGHGLTSGIVHGHGQVGPAGTARLRLRTARRARHAQ